MFSYVQKTLHRIIFLSLLTLSTTANSTIFCVDPAGASAVECDVALQSVANVNALTTLSPGDEVLFKRGGVWNEALLIPASGTSTNPITFGAYGDQQLANPLFDGMSSVSEAPFAWELAESLSDETKKVWFMSSGYSSSGPYWFMVIEENGVQELMRFRGTNFAAGVALQNHEYARINTTPDRGSWTFYVRSDLGPPGIDGRKVYQSLDYATMIDTNGHDHLVIEDMQIGGASAGKDTGAIFLNHSENVVVRNNEIYFSRIAVRSSFSSTYDATASACIQENASNMDAVNSVIEGNDIHHNLEGGIYLKGFSRDNIVRNNKIHHNYRLGEKSGDRLAIGMTGHKLCPFQRARNSFYNNELYNNGTYDVVSDAVIAMYSTEETKVFGNEIRDNSQRAFYFAWSNNSSFYYNKIFGNAIKNGKFFDAHGESNLKLYNNLVYNNTLEATTVAPYNYKSWRMVSTGGPSNNAVIKNNIFSGNVMTGSYNTELLCSVEETVIVDEAGDITSDCHCLQEDADVETQRCIKVPYVCPPPYLVSSLSNTSQFSNNLYFNNNSSYQCYKASRTADPAPVYAEGSLDSPLWSRWQGSLVPYLTVDTFNPEGDSINLGSGVDPGSQFVDSAIFDFHLVSSSSAVNNGVVIGDELTVADSLVDFDNNSIIGLPDIGALEFQPDIDGDGVIDNVDNCLNDPNPAQIDTDDDGIGNACDLDDDNDNLSDVLESILGTDPLLIDTDNDGLSDFIEVNFDNDPNNYQVGVDTDPNNADTDGDTLVDGADPSPLISEPYGDIAPWGAPDGILNAGDLLITHRIVHGESIATSLDLERGDVYPLGSPDGVINVQDLILIRNFVLP